MDVQQTALIKAGRDQDRLIQLYNDQPIFVDSLPGSAYFTRLCVMWKSETGNFDVSNEEILKRLMALRKSGHLATKSEREKREAPRATWPKVITKGGYEIEIKAIVNKDTIARKVQCYWNDKDELPVSRVECFDIVRSRFTEEPEWVLPEVAKRIDQLFPELKWSHESTT